VIERPAFEGMVVTLVDTACGPDCEFLYIKSTACVRYCGICETINGVSHIELKVISMVG
jgi:hypothetical protein